MGAANPPNAAAAANPRESWVTARIAENTVTATSSPKAAAGSINGCKCIAANTVRYNTATPVPCSINA
ncbi:hypothetical protein D3C71_2080510 [compost metagenome]